MEVQPPEYALGGAGLVVLDKLHGKSGLRHILLVVSFHKIASGVTVDGGGDDAQSLDASRVFFYCNLSHVLYSF